MDLAPILLSAAFAGLVAIGVTVAVERLGGLVGGVLGTLPTTIVPATLGIYGGASPEAFERAMYAVPPGMLLNALFLFVWGALPGRLPTLSASGRLAWTLVASLVVWFAGALLLVVALDRTATFDLALGVTVVIVLVGLIATARTRATPRAKKRVNALVLVARGSAAAVAIGIAVLIAARGGDVAAGIVSVFPAIFLTTMLALSLSHGEAVPAGAVGPMMVGSASVAAYPLVAVWALPALGPALGGALAWVIIALGLQLPLYFLARAVVGRMALDIDRSDDL